jgi:hypothetical protein
VLILAEEAYVVEKVELDFADQVIGILNDDSCKSRYFIYSNRNEDNFLTKQNYTINIIENDILHHVNT